MTDSLESVVQTAEASGPALARREWELRERVAELQSELGERIERERIRELELASQRRELEVRFAYNAALEQRVLEHQHQVEWLHGQFALQAQSFAAEHQRVADEFAAERERVAELQRAIEAIQRERDDARAELDAERRRVSSRAVQRWTSRVKKHRVLFAMLRRTARVISG
jgi:colicin import membrane protein